MTTEATLDTTVPTLEPCVHHWRLDAPIGDLTHAVCRLCGSQRDFNQAWHGQYGQTSRKSR